ncbi:MAG: hypothetical protein AAAC47_08735 [Pararhizobium sp.]
MEEERLEVLSSHSSFDFERQALSAKTVELGHDVPELRAIGGALITVYSRMNSCARSIPA